jgi:splicing factor 3B subunit 3
MHLYNLTLQRATAITHAIHGNFSGTKHQEIVISRGKTLEVLRHDPTTGKVYTLLTEEVFSVVRCLLPVRLTGGIKGNQIHEEWAILLSVFFGFAKIH